MSNFTVKLGVENSQFRRGIDQARSDIHRFKQETAAGSGLLSKFAAGFAAIGAAGALRNLVERADRIQDLSEKFGVGAEALQKVGLVAEQSGSSLESVAAAMNKLEIARDKALSGDKELIESFRQLGVSAGDLQSLSADQLLEKIGQSSMNAAPMVATLGKNALELRDTLSQLQGANPQGIISAEDVERLAKFKDDATAIGRTLQSWGAAIAGGVISGIQEASAMISAFVIGIEEKMKGGKFMESMKKAYADAKQFDTFGIGKGSSPRIRSDDEMKSGVSSRTSSLFDRAVSAKEGVEQAIKNKRDAEMQSERAKMQRRAGMTGQEIAQDKLADRREKLAQARGDRRFAKKFGEPYLQELKDREDPVKQAQLAYDKATQELNAEINKTTLAVEKQTAVIEERLSFPSN